MINCPKCDKQIADDSAHCGYCGHQLEDRGKKKTMFGMAALGGDQLKKAVEEAKKAKEEQGEADASDAKPASKLGSGLKIPKPGQKSTGKSTSGGSQGGGRSFKIPKPGQKAEPAAEAPEEDKPQEDESAWAKTERIDLSDAEPPAELSESSEADTQPHDVDEQFSNQQHLQTGADDDGAASTISMTAPSEEDLDSVPPAERAQPSQPSQPSFREPAGPLAEPSGPSQFSQEDEQDEPDQHTDGPSFGGPTQGGPTFGGPTPGGPGGPTSGGPSPASQQGGMNVHQVGTGGAPAADNSSNKGKILAGVLVALLFGGACMLGAVLWVLDYLGIVSIF